jgi:hypothetical protein
VPSHAVEANQLRDANMPRIVIDPAHAALLLYEPQAEADVVARPGIRIRQAASDLWRSPHVANDRAAREGMCAPSELAVELGGEC